VNVFQVVPQDSKNGSGVSMHRHDQRLAGVGCHRHSGQRMRVNASASSGGDHSVMTGVHTGRSLFLS
jgi:hypothetical protein